jgi:putative tricarboxylic transport membrane protein
MVHYDLVTYFSRPICSLLILAGVLTLGFSIYQAVQGIKQKSPAS